MCVLAHITHQGNSQVKNCNIDLLTQELEKFSILNVETINSGFTRFNVIVTSLKSLDLDNSSKNHVRKFLPALPLKWRAKVMVIKEAKDLATLPLDELVGNLKVYEMILENDGTNSRTTTKEKVKSLTLKAEVTREQTSDDNDSQYGNDKDVDEEEKAEAFNLLAKNFWSQGNAKNQTRNEVSTSRVLELLHLVHLTKFDPKSYEGMFFGYSQTSKAYIVLNKETIRIEESLNVTFDESLPEPKSFSLVEDDMINEPIVQDLNWSPSLQANVSDEGYLKSLKEARGHPIEQVIGELNERTLTSKTKQA
ncbi:UBN2 domain-containing protein [Tanacetum coccineum]